MTLYHTPNRCITLSQKLRSSSLRTGKQVFKKAPKRRSQVWQFICKRKANALQWWMSVSWAFMLAPVALKRNKCCCSISQQKVPCVVVPDKINEFKILCLLSPIKKCLIETKSKISPPRSTHPGGQTWSWSWMATHPSAPTDFGGEGEEGVVSPTKEIISSPKD